ncbi:glycosyltransferase family 4 protein [Pseudanabaena yagii]|nr:glycosyltransferase family 4 protein [Pseudanabaena yagii]
MLQTLKQIEPSLVVISQKDSDNIDPQRSFLLHTLRRIEPSLVVISQGDNFDGVKYAEICLELNLPYTIISQKASDTFLPYGNLRRMMQDMYRKAKFSFFVSQHNLSLTESQIGYSLTNAEVIRNPHRALIPEALPYPLIENDCFKIACVARLWILDKGQDILLKVLAQDKWQNRNLQISFFGEGIDRDALMDISTLLGIKNVRFHGFVNNILDIWHHHHALIMPSRAEGLPIALVEAMMCGRLGIVTDVGGISEVVEDNLTGFVSKGAFFTAVDEAMERAWQRRYEWEYIGKQSSIYIRKIIPPYPEKIFADKLIKLSNSQRWK